MKPRAFTHFVHGAAVVVAMFFLVEASLGLEALESPFPPWLSVLVALSALVYAVVDMRREPEELTVVSQIWRCRACGLDYDDEAWVPTPVSNDLADQPPGP